MKNSIAIVLIWFSVLGFSQGLDNPVNNGGKLPSQQNKLNKPLLNGDKKTTVFFQDPFGKPQEANFYEEEDNLQKVSEQAKKRVQQANENLEADLEKRSAGMVSRTEQLLGEIRVKGAYVNIECRDHSAIDGDRVRVIVNGAVVANNIYLTGSYKGIPVDLEKGKNEINFIALNEGDYSPNTAQFKVYDNNDKLVSIKEWALYAGAKATIFVINE